MAEANLENRSALAGHYVPGRVGSGAGTGVTLAEGRDLILSQVAFWPDSIAKVGGKLAKDLGVQALPGPGRSFSGNQGSLLRIDPLKVWIFGAGAPAFEADQAVTLDLSHSRTHVRIAGDEAATLLNRYLPLDLREASFPSGAVASTAFHHCGVTLWRTDGAFELFLPRNFAVSLWDLLLEGAAQFGCEVL
ncbi:MAG: sarcosine oxidase subunit gamma [Pseudomonadota bacterium]